MLNLVRLFRVVLAMSVLMASARAQQHIASAVQAAEHARAEMVAEDRQKKMLADADQLVAMAQQLKSAVDQTKKDELSVQVIKQADQIEKLAKSVKDRMRQ
ncbi:hypothetical protein SAMN05443244_0155 [Terriglobus roseus]|uniref:Uncharacterized protein n=2 Tax=Terriglobus roseus TaxID=392734 RepID=A0A1H4IWK7_9BACT|nr:hypothetical protein SAMN05443244_0155 [Terriglobus roseus]